MDGRIRRCMLVNENLTINAAACLVDDNEKIWNVLELWCFSTTDLSGPLVDWGKGWWTPLTV